MVDERDEICADDDEEWSIYHRPYHLTGGHTRLSVRETRHMLYYLGFSIFCFCIGKAGTSDRGDKEGNIASNATIVDSRASQRVVSH